MLEKGCSMIKRKNLIVKQNKGMTMVEILLGFVILMVMMGMLSGIIVFASNLYYESVDLKKAETALARNLYREDLASGASTVKYSDVISLRPEDSMPGEHASLKLNADLYSISSSDMLTGSDAEALDVRVYFLKEREKDEDE